MKFFDRTSRSSRVLFQFTASYLLLMLIPLFIGITAYTIALRAANEQVIHFSELALERAASEVECAVSEAKAFTTHLNSLSPVHELLDDSYPDEDRVLFLRNAISNLTDFRDTYGLIQRYFIYSSSNGFILDPRNAYTNLSRYYTTTFRYGDLSMQEFEKQLLLSEGSLGIHPVTSNTYLSKEYDSMVYVSMLMSPSRRFGRAVFYLDQEALVKRLQLHFGTEAEYVGIYRLDGVPLLSTDNSLQSEVYSAIPISNRSGSVNLKKLSCLAAYCYSDLLDATFIVAIPQRYVSDQLANMRVTLFMGMGVMLLIGIVLCWTLYVRNRRPLAAVINSLPENKADQGNNLWWLEDAVRSLTQKHQEMEQTMQLQRIALRDAVIHQLIQGGFQNEEEMESQLEYVGVHLEGEWFCAVLVRLGLDGEWNENMSPQGDIRRTKLMALLSGFEPKLLYMGWEDQNTCAMLYVGQDEDAVDESFIQAFYHALVESGETDALISVGTRQRSLTPLYHSFRVAEQQLERAADGNWLLLPNRSAHSGYHFTTNDEKRLSALISSSKAEEVDAAMEHLWEENFVKRNITGFERTLLYCRMIDTALKASGEAELFSVEKDRITQMNADDFFAIMRKKFKEICTRGEEKRQQSSNQLLQNVLSYLEQNYQDYDTTLASTAMAFGLTEKYLSAFFKEKAGINFSTHLESLRMNRATQLLKTTSMTVEEISREVGYSSAKSFSRAYYRCMGQTPSRARG